MSPKEKAILIMNHFGYQTFGNNSGDIDDIKYNSQTAVDLIIEAIHEDFADVCRDSVIQWYEAIKIEIELI